MTFLMFKVDYELFTVFKTSKLIAGALLDVRVNCRFTTKNWKLISLERLRSKNTVTSTCWIQMILFSLQQNGF